MIIKTKFNGKQGKKNSMDSKNRNTVRLYVKIGIMCTKKNGYYL